MGRFAFCLYEDHVKFVLRISSAHNKGGPTDINIAQTLHLSNFFELKRSLVYIHLQENSFTIQFIYNTIYLPEKCQIAVQNVNKGFVYITDFTYGL